jgi:hypothetical protein
MNGALPTVYENENNEAVKMHAHEIERYLAELGQELQNLGVQHRIRILLVGGAFMLTQIHNRTSTNDVDVLVNVPPHRMRRLLRRCRRWPRPDRELLVTQVQDELC